MSSNSYNLYKDSIRTAKVTTVQNILLDSNKERLMVMLKTIIRMQMDDGHPCTDGCHHIFSECTRWFDDDKALRTIEDVLARLKVIIPAQNTFMWSICPICLVPTAPMTLIDSTCDIYGHGPEPDPPCTANSLDIFGEAIELLNDPIVRAVFPFLTTTEERQYGDEVASFLSRNDLDRLPNIYMLFLLHYFLQPSVSFTPLASDALMASALTPNGKPRPEIGPSRRENLQFVQMLSTAYQTAVGIDVQNMNRTLPIKGGSTSYESFLDRSTIKVVSEFRRIK